jgi:hypothetical protein
MMTKWKQIVVLVLICFFALLLLAGCDTSFDEWSGNMPNQAGQHVEPWSPDTPATASPTTQPNYWTSGGAGAPPQGQPPSPPYSPPPPATPKK